MRRDPTPHPHDRRGPVGGARALRASAALLLALAAGGTARAGDPAPAAPREARDAVVTLRPGGVVRWPGDGIESCLMAGRRFAPVAEACWFAVDLLTPAGELEVGRSVGDRLETRRVRVTDYPYDVQRITLDDSSTVDLSAENLERVAAEQARVAALWNLPSGPPHFRLPLAAPLERLPEGGRFGSRRIFNGQPRSPHTGADYSAAEGTPVLAVAAGRVVLADDLFFSGGSVFLDHGAGLISMYFHLSSIGAEEGQEVERGEAVGRVGATGRATGPHLHFGLRWHGSRIDPAPLLGSADATPVLR